jgi:hypothetical protein
MSSLKESRCDDADERGNQAEEQARYAVQGKMLDACRYWLARVVTRAVFGSAVCGPAIGKDVKLVIRPQKAPAELGKWSLLPSEQSLIDGDAVPLYEKAVKALPSKTDDDLIRIWLDVPLRLLPVQRVQQALQHYDESFRYAGLAARCRQSNWAQWRPGIPVPYRKEYRRIVFANRLWTRLEIANDRYEEAILALQTGFGMAKHLAHAPAIVQVMIGTAIGQVGCGEVEALVQRKEAPNLQLALASLPKPFVDLESAIGNEMTIASSYGELTTGEKVAQDQCRMRVKRFHVNLAALECVEAIRSYAASHGGRLPQSLAEMEGTSLPKDPTSGAPFCYTRTGATAVLESPAPAGDEGGGLRYKILVKN